MLSTPGSPSLRSRLVCRVLDLAYKRRWATREAGFRALAAPKEPSTPPPGLAARTRSRQVGGFTVHRVEPADGVRSGGTVVYLHGGGYVHQIVKQHWALVADLADATGRPVDVAIYGLAPEHNGLQALAFGRQLLAELDVETAARPGPVHLVGDSAGGGLALILAQDRRDAGAAPADGVVVMAPWLDLSMSNPEVDALEPHDPWLTRAGLRPVADVWAAGLELTDPRISPLFADQAGLPPVDIFVGTRDITLCDSRILADRIRAAGGAAGLHEAVGAPHVHPLLPILPEGHEARRRLIATVVG